MRILVPFFILLISSCDAMEQEKLLFCRLINEEKRVSHYRSESQLFLKNRGPKTSPFKRPSLSQRIKGIRKRGADLEKGFASNEIWNEYTLHVEKLLKAYQETFEMCKQRSDLAGLLFEFDSKALDKKGGSYRPVFRWLIPFIMALNDPGFDLAAKIDALVMFEQNYADVLDEGSRFVFRPSGLEFDDESDFLKIIALYNFCLIATRNEYIDRLRAGNPNLAFERINYLDVIANFDYFVNLKNPKPIEQKDSASLAPMVRLDLSQDLEKVKCLAQLKGALQRSWFICCYFTYKKFAEQFQSQPEKQQILKDFFWNDYLEKAFFERITKFLGVPVRFFEGLMRRFDRYIDEKILGLSSIENFE